MKANENIKVAAGCLLMLVPAVLAVPLSIVIGIISQEAWAGLLAFTVIEGMLALWLVAGMLKVAKRGDE